MELENLIKIAEQVPELHRKIQEMETEIRHLKRQPGYKDVLTVGDLHRLTGFKSPTTIRKMINDIGNSKYRGKDFVLREDFRDFFKSLKQLSDEEINDLIEDYEINEENKLTDS
jgi:hypothetical protein